MPEARDRRLYTSARMPPQSDPSQPRVHVIEDDKDIREEAVFALGELGFEATGFAEGEGASPTPLHLAFAADNRSQVDAFHRAATAAGGRDNDAPGLRRDYHPNYYAAFVMAPDGHNVEVVCDLPEG